MAEVPQIGPHEVIPFRPERNGTIDTLRWARKRLTVSSLLEIDVTAARRAIREFRMRTGQGLSLTAWVVSSVARAAVVFAFAALDDITTDNATSFVLEYAFLLVCASWFLFVAAMLYLRGRRLTGILSLLILLGGFGGGYAIRQGIVPGAQTAYAAIMLSLAWFFAVSLTMIVSGVRRLS